MQTDLRNAWRGLQRQALVNEGGKVQAGFFRSRCPAPLGRPQRRRYSPSINRFFRRCKPAATASRTTGTSPANAHSLIPGQPCSQGFRR